MNRTAGEIPHRILIVDDNKTNLLAFKTIVGVMPVAIDTAMSGAEALQLASTNGYSLVLLDIQMPEMDGFETLGRLREIPGHEFTPIILISAVYTEDQYRIKGIQTGAVDFIPKPVSPDILRAKVKVFIDLEENRTKLNALIEELKIKNKLLTDEIEKGMKITAELEIARAKAEKDSEYKSQLLVNMSHEIRTPVNSILGFADLITNPSVSTKDKEKYLRYVSSSSQNLLFLIDEILEHSRLEAGEVNINPMPVDLNELCAELMDSFENIKVKSGKEKIALVLENDPQEKGLIVITDYQRIRQVLSNLIGNAFKYTESGKIAFGFVQKESTVEFFIKDSGIGVSPDDIKEIFNRFKRAESNAEITVSGTGLGLSISKNLINLMGGKIWVESELNKGSVFRFAIPLILPEAGSVIVSASTSRGVADNPDWKNKTLVIAEDEELNFLFLMESLRSTGINILWAKTGRESIDLVSIHPEIDLVLMDIRMPDLDGYQATRMIKSINPGLPVIFQTAFVQGDEKSKIPEHGGDEYITKPINRLDLLKTMSLYLNR